MGSPGCGRPTPKLMPVCLRPRKRVRYTEEERGPKTLCTVQESLVVLGQKGLFAAEDIRVADAQDPVWIANFGKMSKTNRRGEHAWSIRRACGTVEYEQNKKPSLAAFANHHCCGCNVKAAMHRIKKGYALFLYKSVCAGEEICIHYHDQVPSACSCCREITDTETGVTRMICIKCNKAPRAVQLFNRA